MPATITWDDESPAAGQGSRITSMTWDDPPSKPAPATPATKAPSTGVVMGLRDPIDALVQIAERAMPSSVSTGINRLNNWLADKGVPLARVEESDQGATKLVADVNKAYEAQRRQEAMTLGGLVTGQQPEPGFDWGRLAGNVVNPANIIPGNAVMRGATTVGQLVTRGALAGATSGVLQPVVNDIEGFWGQKAGQAVTGAVSGGVATPVIAKGTEAAVRGVVGAVQAARNAATSPVVNGAAVDEGVTAALRSQGLDAADVPPQILGAIRQQVQEALSTGGRIDPAAIGRRAQFEAVGLSGDAAPTLGQMTRDPIQYAQERNLSGVALQTGRGQGNPLADRFAAQNRALGGVFDLAGASGATDRVTAGQQLIGALREADAPVKEAVDQAYTAARGMAGGRVAELERATFAQSANDALDKQMLGVFLPTEVSNLMNKVAKGEVPFTVETAVQIDTLLSAAQRKAQRGGDDAAAKAVGVVRSALHDTPLAQLDNAAAGAAGAVDGAAVGAPRLLPSGAAAPSATDGEAARAAFDEARKAARSRFATIEQTPALKAALDDAAPDMFVQNFVIGANVRDAQALKQVLANSPEALAQARAQVADHLKRAAFGSNASGDAQFMPARYMEALRAIGKQKLEVFFTPEEVVRFNLAGKVASDINSVPAGARNAVNYSNTGSAVLNLLSKVSEAPIMRQIPGARALANQVGEIRTERAINRALSGEAPKPAAEMSPEVERALRLFFPAVPVAAGSAGGASLQ